MEFSGNRAVLGTPLVEVFSVSIKPFGDRCDVYGTIQVIDDIGELYLYNQDPNNAESIYKYGTISISNPDHPISAAAEFTVTLDLRDKNGDIEFIKGSFTWDATNLTDYDKCLSHDFKGKLGLATMHFTVLTVAVDASFAAFLDNAVGSDGANVYGRIVAYYEKNFNYLVGKDLEDHSRFILFDRTVVEAVTLKDGDEIPLLRDCVAVPSYSSLVFEADLKYINSYGDKEQSVNGKLEFPAQDYYYYDKTIEKQGGLINIVVEWRHANEIEGSPSLGMSKIEKYLYGGFKLLEVFSARVFMNQTNVEGGEVYGAIRVCDGRSDMSIYSCREKNCKPILPDGTLALTGPSCAIRASNFGLTFSVNERHGKFEICNGYWPVTPFCPWKWLDCRMSAVVEGKDGYGVLHFTIFHNAVQANVEVTLPSGGISTIHGSLVAYYGNYEYKSDYVRKFFRTKLLDVPKDEPIEVEVKPASALLNVPENDPMMGLKPESEDEPVELKHKPAIKGTILPLSRHVVVVPGCSSLIIEANLSCSTRTGISTSPQLVQGSATFLPLSSGVSSEHIGDEVGGIDVTVSWLNDISWQPVETKRHLTDEVSSEKKNKVN